MDDKDKIDKLIDKLIAIHDELQTEIMHKDIVKKYDGMMNFNQRGNTFYVYVSLEKNTP